ncbi:hypothetical protein [Streptomyces sp. JJ36]|uniref:hypothetical protein n=1 Tax=Streptomyces sp. JJ36 TaxID=2736645 RepID=UPI001F181BD7|nr:hypothetical protein [Streptomyces sp. JJ36]MCF6524578.1 hypothetical protein [Streptomyces sp. JJ36]
MSDAADSTAGGRGGVPRDLPDQQAGAETEEEAAADPGGADVPAEELPDTDETGTGPRTPGTEQDDPEAPRPDEPTD